MGAHPPAGAARPRLLALDLDGTLLTSDKRIPPRSRQALRRVAEGGVRVVITTGRPARSARGFARALGLPHPFICYNGAAVYDPTLGTVRVRRYLPVEAATEALRRLRSTRPGVLVGLESEDGWYLDPALHALRERETRLGPEPPDGVGAIETYLPHRPIKLFARHPHHDARDLAAPLADLPLYRTWSSPALLELMHPEVNKRDALAELAASLGIARAEVAAFGDQRNDVEMLAWAGFGVAMANGCEEARAAADHVTGSNDEEGVAAVLERWIEGPGT